jgi:hypothetical protein
MATATQQIGEATVRPFKRPAGNFSFATASDRELLAAGFPARPSDPRLRKHYDALVKRLDGKLQWIEPEFVPLEGKGRGLNQKRGHEAAEKSGNWCGVEVAAAAGESVSWVGGSWVVPNVSHPTKNKNYYSCHWVGIDGDGVSPLFQAGVECDVTGGDDRSFYAWYEWLPDMKTQVKIKNMKVNAGDYVTAIVCSDHGAGSTTGTVYFTNTTLGLYTSFAVSAPHSALDGLTAEWISEVTMINGVIDITSLADFGEIYFGDAFAGTTSHNFLDAANGTQIEMENTVGTDYGIGIPIAPGVARTVYSGPAGTE